MLNGGTEIIKLYIHCKSLRAGLQHPAEILLEGIKKLCNVAPTLLKYYKKCCASKLAVKNPQCLVVRFNQLSMISRKKVKTFPLSYEKGSYTSELRSYSLTVVPLFFTFCTCPHTRTLASSGCSLRILSPVPVPQNSSSSFTPLHSSSLPLSFFFVAFRTGRKRSAELTCQE